MHPYEHFGFMPQFFYPFGLLLFPIFMLLALWTIAIKGYALWHAARNDQKWWFIAILIVNTLGILEIVYLLWFRGDRKAKEAKNESVVTPIESDTSSSEKSSVNSPD